MEVRAIKTPLIFFRESFNFITYTLHISATVTLMALAVTAVVCWHNTKITGERASARSVHLNHTAIWIAKWLFVFDSIHVIILWKRQKIKIDVFRGRMWNVKIVRDLIFIFSGQNNPTVPLCLFAVCHAIWAGKVG